MPNCPHCNQPLTPDANNPGKLLCYNCRKRFDEDKINQYWAAQTPDPVAYSQTDYAQQGYGQTPPAAYSNAPQAPAKLPKGMAVAALVLGILAILNCWLPLVNIVAIVMGIIGIILGIVALRKVSAGTGSGKGLSIGGIVCGAIGVVVSIIISFGTVALFNTALEESNLNMEDLTAEIERLGNENVDAWIDENMDTSVDQQLEEANFNDGGVWTSMEFSFCGRPYKLMETTLAQLEETGWVLDLAVEGYPEGYTVEPNQMISLIQLQQGKNPDTTVYVNVVNTTDSPLDIHQCLVASISLDSTVPTDVLNIQGVQCGMTMEDALTILGEPHSNYHPDENYYSITYEVSDYTKDLTFTAGNDGVIITGIEMASTVD